MSLNTILTPVGVVKFKKKVYFEWVERWAIIDRAGIPVANVDGEESAIEIASLINREHYSENKDYIYNDKEDYSSLFELGEEYCKKQNGFGLGV